MKSNEDGIVKAISSAHESAASLFSIFIPILAVLFVGFQNTSGTVDVLGAKFTPGQGAVVAVILIVVACYFSTRNLFVMLSLLHKLQNKGSVRTTLQTSSVLLNPFTDLHHRYAGRIFNYSGLVLMHIAPLGVVLAFSDLIVARQRSLLLVAVHFSLVFLFGLVYILFYQGLAAVIDIVNPADAPLRRRILKIAIGALVVLFLVYDHFANLENFRRAIQETIK